MEAHALAQALSRGRKGVGLHHIAKLKFATNLPAVNLKPSVYNARLGVRAEVPEQDLENPKFKPREGLRY